MYPPVLLSITRSYGLKLGVMFQYIKSYLGKSNRSIEIQLLFINILVDFDYFYERKRDRKLFLFDLKNYG